MRLVEASQRLGDEAQGQRRQYRQCQLAAFQARDGARVVAGIVDFQQAAAHLIAQQQADLGDPHAPRAAVEQLDVQRIFQVADQLRKRRLGHPDFIGRAGK
jgi:hypothetical protein